MLNFNHVYSFHTSVVSSLLLLLIFVSIAPLYLTVYFCFRSRIFLETTFEFQTWGNVFIIYLIT